MSEQQLQAFWQAVDVDAALQEQLKAVGDMDPEAVVAIAKAAGFMISADDLAMIQAEIGEDELLGVVAASQGSQFSRLSTTSIQQGASLLGGALPGGA